MKSRLFVLAGFLLVAFASCEQKPMVNFERLDEYVVNGLSDAMALTDSLKSVTEQEELIDIFKQARMAYKRVEPFAAYYNSEAAHRVNGPPLPVFREDNNKVLPAVGFQAIEEIVYADDEVALDELAYKTDITVGYLSLLRDKAAETMINPQRFFVPMHLQLMRIYSLGLTGFDTPTSLIGMQETPALIREYGSIYQMAIGDTIRSISPDLHDSFLEQLESAAKYVEDHPDFATFDRYEFGRSYLNKLTASWVQIRKQSGLFEDPGRFALNLDAPTFFEDNSFNLDFFRSSYNSDPTQDQVVLGEALFYDPQVSSSGNLSCASCHNPTNVFQDGYQRGIDKDGKDLLRNTPTIVNSIYQQKFFWDGRSDNLEQQISSVFVNEREFDASHEVSDEVLQSARYQEMFAKAYPDKKLTKTQMVRAISSYVSTLNAMNSRFDKNMRGELDDFTSVERLGMNLFMGKALCATCHFIPLTNGTVPPTFAETEKEILGTPKTAENTEIDPDLGFYWVFEEDVHKYMFKTPTVRNASLTAPYMHNGVYETMEQVMDFYNKGGGGGMGFDLEHQTLPFDSLALSEEEQQAIIAFMETMTDTTSYLSEVPETIALN